MVLFEESGKVLLYGGSRIKKYTQGWYSIGLDDLWEYNGISWKKLTPTDPENDGNPAEKSEHAMVYFPKTKR